MKKIPRNFNRDLFKPDCDMTEKEVKKYLFDKVWEHFCKWMEGQTMPVLSDGKGGFFKHDVERYMEGILHGRPTFRD